MPESPPAGSCTLHPEAAAVGHCARCAGGVCRDCFIEEEAAAYHKECYKALKLGILEGAPEVADTPDEVPPEAEPVPASDLAPEEPPPEERKMTAEEIVAATYAAAEKEDAERRSWKRRFESAVGEREEEAKAEPGDEAEASEAIDDEEIPGLLDTPFVRRIVFVCVAGLGGAFAGFAVSNFAVAVVDFRDMTPLRAVKMFYAFSAVGLVAGMIAGAMLRELRTVIIVFAVGFILSGLSLVGAEPLFEALQGESRDVLRERLQGF